MKESNRDEKVIEIDSYKKYHRFILNLKKESNLWDTATLFKCHFNISLKQIKSIC